MKTYSVYRVEYFYKDQTHVNDNLRVPDYDDDKVITATDIKRALQVMRGIGMGNEQVEIKSFTRKGRLEPWHKRG